ncbi:hypothetical protein DERF_013962 [Dermatophagoides farinae]|uniref:Uncharacterized protein n=1 Tax=Dermatophagoides farinae TaxID=6954 RepID=A0A922HNP4_DERFA|nr:hypothetical protein DERF_013962 [Dermatophagoides farinae]
MKIVLCLYHVFVYGCLCQFFYNGGYSKRDIHSLETRSEMKLFFTNIGKLYKSTPEYCNQEKYFMLTISTYLYI